MAAVRLRAARVCGPKAHTPEPPAGTRIFWREATKNSSFKNKKDYKDEDFMCDSCETEVDEKTHVLYCKAYKELLQGKDLQSDNDLASGHLLTGCAADQEQVETVSVMERTYLLIMKMTWFSMNRTDTTSPGRMTSLLEDVPGNPTGFLIVLSINKFLQCQCTDNT